MTSPQARGEKSVPPEDSEERRSPREVLDAFEDKMKRRVKQFDLRVLDNKRSLEKIRGHLSGYLDDCQKALERRLSDLDARVDELAARVEAWDKKVARQEALDQGAER